MCAPSCFLARELAPPGWACGEDGMDSSGRNSMEALAGPLCIDLAFLMSQWRHRGGPFAASTGPPSHASPGRPCCHATGHPRRRRRRRPFSTPRKCARRATQRPSLPRPARRRQRSCNDALQRCSAGAPLPPLIRCAPLRASPRSSPFRARVCDDPLPINPLQCLQWTLCAWQPLVLFRFLGPSRPWICLASWP